MTNNRIMTLVPYFIAIPLAIVVVICSMLHYYKGKPVEVAEAAPVDEEVQPEEMIEIPVEEVMETFGEAEGSSESETAEEELEETMAMPSWHFYNSDLQSNGDAKDDYNFGPNPMLTDEFTAKVMEAIKAKNYKGTINIDDLFKDVDASGLDREFRERLRVDPALGAADMAWFDSIVGTRYLGEFYSEAKNQWDAAMNNAKDRWIEDGDEYSRTLDAFEKYLNSATKIEIRRASGLTDQMYMNPFTVDGEIPDIVVMESADHAGWFLVYTFTIKETAVKEVMYRLDCGFQPTNVAKVMKVKVNPNPTTKKKSDAGGKSSATPTPTTAPVIPGTIIVPKNPTPGPNPPLTPEYNKDPSKGTPVLPNDDPGPGPNTNTGKGGQYSSKDQVGNSNDLTPSEYKETIEEMKDNPGKEAGDSTPSTQPSSGETKVDNNGKEADKPTEKSGSSVANDDAGSSWGGPPD